MGEPWEAYKSLGNEENKGRGIPRRLRKGKILKEDRMDVLGVNK